MHSKHRSAARLIIATVTFLAGGAALAGPGLDQSPADVALDLALKKLVAMPGGPPGVIAVVQRGDDRRVHRFGVANIADGRRVRVNGHMRVASVAKAFNAATALSLVSKGRLSLGDTVGRYLPDLPMWSEVTLRQLLGHTSGLPDFSQSGAFQKAVFAHPLD